MTTDESGSKDQTESGAPDSVSEPSETKEERSSRMNAAKAFYRAMYAGEDVDPEAFGMGGPQGAGGSGGGGGDSRDRGPCPSCARMEAQVQEAQNKQVEAENYYKRIAADFENYRRRTEKERDEFMMNGIQKAIEALLPALDDLDRAKSSLSNVTDPKQITESLNLVFQRFGKCLEGLGVKPLEVIGTPFDPRLHEPVQEIETQEFPDGVVMHELRRGYAFKEKTLRPSLVNVASNPSGVVVPAQTAGAKDQQEEAKPEEKDASAATGEPPSEAKEESALAESKTGHEENKSEEAHKEKESKPPRRKASSQDRNFDATATADLPVFQVDESMMLNIDPESETEKTVYDISDAEEMDEVT